MEKWKNYCQTAEQDALVAVIQIYLVTTVSKYAFVIALFH